MIHLRHAHDHGIISVLSSDEMSFSVDPKTDESAYYKEFGPTGESNIVVLVLSC